MSKIELILVLVFIQLFLQNHNFCQDSIFVFPPEDNLCISLDFNYQEIHGDLHFKYKIKSHDCSKQPIWEFRIETKTCVKKISSPPKWNGTVTELKYNTISWGSTDSSGLIYKNQSLSGFKIVFNGLPSICNFFISGYTPIPIFDQGDEPAEIMNHDIFETSFKGKTIGPKNIEKELNHKKFIENLIKDIDSSYSLNWIKKYKAYNRYIKILKKAKKNLFEMDTNSASFELFRVLKHVEIDHQRSLTNEAYALLKSNTEFLLKNLPEIDPLNMFDVLLQFIDKFYKDGEISKQGIYKGLYKKIENGKSKFEKKKIKAVRNLLRAFKNTLRAQKSKGITINCYHTLIDYVDFILNAVRK